MEWVQAKHCYWWICEAKFELPLLLIIIGASLSTSVCRRCGCGDRCCDGNPSEMRAVFLLAFDVPKSWVDKFSTTCRSGCRYAMFRWLASSFPFTITSSRFGVSLHTCGEVPSGHLHAIKRTPIAFPLPCAISGQCYNNNNICAAWLIRSLLIPICFDVLDNEIIIEKVVNVELEKRYWTRQLNDSQKMCWSTTGMCKLLRCQEKWCSMISNPVTNGKPHTTAPRLKTAPNSSSYVYSGNNLISYCKRVCARKLIAEEWHHLCI